MDTGVPEIYVSRPDEATIHSMNLRSWPIWTKEPSTFSWYYEEPETCFFLEGEVIIETSKGQVKIKKGDLVTFPKGLSCKWNVKQGVRKHYKFGD